MSRTVAVVDDEPDIVELVSLHLKKAGFNVKEFTDAEHFYRFLQQEVPDLVVLDLMLPDADGFEICKYVRNHERLSGTPIIMLTARVDEADRVLGLELGADDYVTKPFSPRELVARVKAVLRRRDSKAVEPKAILLGGSIVIDPGRYDVEVDGKRIELTTTEFRILELLASRKGWVFSREKILQHLWGDNKMVLDRTIDVHIKHLREKLGEAGRFIRNVRGVGYKVAE